MRLALKTGKMTITVTSTRTLVFLSMERGAFEFYAKENDTLSFVISEATMTFSVNYVKDGKLIRSFVESDGNLLQNSGESLEFEKTEADKSELIYHLFKELLGASFDAIDLDAKCYRYKFSKNQIKENNPGEKQEIDHPLIEKIKKIAHSPANSKQEMVVKMGAIEVLEGNLDPDLYVTKIGLKKQEKKRWKFWK